MHHQHGVGQYEGMVKRTIGGIERDYLLVAYKGGDKLYVPSDQIDTLRQYVGGEAPTLHRLGGSDFAKAKSRVRSAVREIAQELVVLYQKRVNGDGHAFGPDTPWQHEMEEAFPYVETPDQRVAIDDVKATWSGRTRWTAWCAATSGSARPRSRSGPRSRRSRTASRSPCSRRRRCSPTSTATRSPIASPATRSASRCCRASSPTPRPRQVIDGLRTGEVDCVIGTHRLLTNDVKFKDLGLLVVDEEQRFGVQHKEAMKKLKVNVDVITLTATPIPRTLEMSLVGIRDLSLLQTPPADRQPILTYVGEYDERVAIEAIRRELLREGQVFWVHNRVRSIETAAARLRQLVPEARIAVAHGQMDEGTLEQVVVDFWEGRYDVLVCTTIIESGIDMPTVNTLVVERADLLGLGQMHQLRGRVGRSGQRAYAYLFHPRDRTLTEEAYERLRTIGESTELGSGFKIAMRDLEIRGAGNLLGESQSGHIAAVGYDLYCQMVTEAVAEMKGEPIAPPSEIKLDVPTDAFLPADYVTKEELRLEAYRRLAAVTSESEVDDIRAEWEDRYGPLPEPAEALLMVGSLRAECHRLGITDMQITVSQARLSPIELKLSESMRLKRLATGRDPQGGPAPARRPDRPRQGPGDVPRRLPPRADPRRRPVGSAGVSRRAVVVPILLLAGAATGCSTVSDNDAAARVDEFELSQDEFGELLVGGDARSRARRASVELSGETARDLLNTWILTRILEVDLAAQGDDRRRRQAIADATGALEAAGPRQRGRRRRLRLQNLQIEQQAAIATWSALEVPTPSDDELRALYDAGTAESGIVCGAHILVETEAEAQAILDQLEGGADFAELAASESIDTGSGANGGNLPCALTGDFEDRLRPRVRRGGPGGRVRRAGRAGAERVRVPRHRAATVGSGRPGRAGGAVHRLTSARFQRAADAVDIYVDPRFGAFNSASGVVALG